MRTWFITGGTPGGFGLVYAEAALAQGDQVVVLGEDAACVRATGKVLEGEWAHVFTLRNGKVARFHEYLDTAELVAELRAAHAKA